MDSPTRPPSASEIQGDGDRKRFLYARAMICGSCGFANPDLATACRRCGATLTPMSGGGTQALGSPHPQGANWNPNAAPLPPGAMDKERGTKPGYPDGPASASRTPPPPQFPQTGGVARPPQPPPGFQSQPGAMM